MSKAGEVHRLAGLVIADGGVSIHWATRPDGTGSYVKLVIGEDGVVRAEPLVKEPLR